MKRLGLCIITFLFLCNISSAQCPIITEQPIDSQLVCHNGWAETLFAFTDFNPDLNYQWYSNTTKSYDGAIQIENATFEFYFPPTTGIGTIYYYCIIVNNVAGCADTTSIAAVTVTDIGDIIEQPLDAQTVCLNATAQPLIVTAKGSDLSYQWYSNTVENNDGATLIEGATLSSYTPPATQTGTMYYFCEITADCGINNSNIVSVKVDPLTTITTEPINAEPVCLNTVAQPFTVAASGAGLMFQWYNNTTESYDNATLIDGATLSSYDPPTTQTGTIYYYCIVNGCNADSSDIVSVRVDTTTAITVHPIDSQRICLNDVAQPLTITANGAVLTYQWYRSFTKSYEDGITIEGTTASSYEPPTISGIMYYYCIVTGSCGADSSNIVSVRVDAQAVITVQPISSQTVCINASAQSLTIAATGTGLTYQWYSNNTESYTGATQVEGEIESSYAPPTTQTGTIYYYCIVNGCNADSSDIVSVRVDTTTAITVHPIDSQRICLNDVVQPLTVEATGAGLTYQWYRSFTKSYEDGITIEGASASSYEPPTQSGTMYYYCIVTGSCGADSSNIVSVRVDAQAVITVQPINSQTVCINASAQSLTIAATGTGLTYQWYSNNTESYTGATQIEGEVESSYTPPTTQTGTIYYYCIVNGCNADSSDIVFVRVDTITAINMQPIDSQRICLNDVAQPLTITANGAVLTYQWYRSFTKSYEDGITIEGASASSYEPPTQSGTMYYYCIVTGSCGADSSNIVSVRVDAQAVITVQPINSQTVCINTAAESLTIAASGTELIYQWYSNTTKSYDATQIEGEVQSSYAPSTTQPGITYYYCIATGSCGADSSNIVSVKVDAITDIIVQPIDSQAICLNDATQPLTVEASGAELAYQWYRNFTESYEDGITIEDATALSYVPPTQSGTTYYYCIVTGSCGTDSSNIVSVKVNPTTAIIAQPIASQTVCLNKVVQPLTVTANGSGLTYQWYSNPIENYNGAKITNATLSSYLPSTTQSGTTYYYCIVSGSCGADSSNIVSVRINAITSITAQPIASQTVCLNNVVQTLTVAASGAGLIYRWYSNTIESYRGATEIEGELQPSYDPPTTEAGTTYYYCVVTGNCDADSSDIVSVKIDAITAIITEPKDSQTVCLNTVAQPLAVIASGSVLTYQWYSNTTENYNGATRIAGATLSSYNPPTTQTGITYYYCIVTGSCDTISSNISKVAILSTPTFTWLNLNNDNKLCKGSRNINFNVSSPADTIQYVWTTVPAGNSKVTIKDPNNANTVISFNEPGAYTLGVTAVNQGSGCGNSTIQTVNVTDESGIDNRKIILKQPGSLLVYPDNSMDAGKGYQWGYDSVIHNDPDYSFASPIQINGQVYQFFTPDERFLNAQNDLDTVKYKYWVLLQKGGCYTKVYYNGPYADQLVQAPPLQNAIVRLNVLPNPNNGIFKMVLKGNIYGTIDAKIYNATGVLLFQKQFIKTTAEMHETIKIENLFNGLYYLKINSSDTKTAVTRFIIQH